MRAYAGPPVLTVALAHPKYGTWNDVPPEKRERKGVYPGANIVTETMLQGGVMNAHARLLSNAELWSIYRQSPDVRACVDSITRVISTWDWAVEPVESLPQDDPMYDLAVDAAEEARRFLTAPNDDGEVWQTFSSKLIRDLLVFDVWASENVLGPGGVLEELVTLPGGTVHPRVDRHQRLVDYAQVTGEEEVFLDREQVVYFNLFPNTHSPGGTPIIESLINEIITLMRSSKHLMLAYDADEVPPGILLLAGIAGAAAERAVTSLKNMKGADHKLRVLTTNNPQGVAAKWVEFRHTPKDLDMKDLTHETRRTIWRLFGVKPITMGDSEATPRATAEVQVEAQDSGLIRPIIELLQAQINMRILPLVIGDPELASLVTFQFDLSKNTTAQDTKDEADADGSDFDRGGLTINELRAKRGRLPVEGGDMPLLKTGGGYSTLEDVLNGEQDSDGETIFDAEASDDEEGGGGVDSETADADSPEEGEEAPGEVEASKPSGAPVVRNIGAVIPQSRGRSALTLRRRGAGCSCGSHDSEPSARMQRRASPLLPSEWQSEGKFKGYRTVNLNTLGRVLIDYSRAVSPLYRRARIDTVAAFRARTADGDMTTSDAAALASDVTAILDRLHSGWDGATSGMYRDAAMIGRDAATDFTGVQVVDDWRERGEMYQRQAMAYLVDTRGLITDIKTQLQTLLVASVRGTEDNVLVTRAGLEDFDYLALLGAVSKVFGRNEHRIDNWSGRLVELTNNILGLGMGEGGSGEDLPPEERGQPWYVAWTSVGDKRMCLTCEREGSRGPVPLSTLNIRPGGDTECRARCRCVLVFWSKEEVDNGTWVDLS